MPCSSSTAASMPGSMADLIAGIADVARLLPLLRELGNLKRIRSAGRDGSVAERLFLSSWAALMQGETIDRVMARVCAAALVAVRLGDLDRQCLSDLGLNETEISSTLQQAFDEVVPPLDPRFIAKLRAAVPEGASQKGEPPGFALQLADQPRAGVTCPGKPRIMLQPAENHAEHCLMVAIYGAVVASIWKAAPASAFLAGLAHHLHNASLPDAGFTGETLLGDALLPAMHRAREAALLTMPAALAADVRDALAPIADDTTAEARAFHAADVLDRVLEIEQHLTRTSVTMEDVLGPYALVHDSPVKPFHDLVLKEAGFS